MAKDKKVFFRCSESELKEIKRKAKRASKKYKIELGISAYLRRLVDLDT